MKKIVFLDSHAFNPGDLDMSDLEALGHFVHYPESQGAEVVERCRNADIIISNKVLIDAELMQQLPDLQCICVAATGYNNVDIQVASERRIPVFNVTDYSTPGVAQHVFALLLEWCNRTGQHTREVAEGRWTNAGDWCYWDQPIIELAGRNMGIFGFGRTGQEVARIARAFGMKLLVTHTRQLEGWPDVEWVDEQELFSHSDVLSLHAPLTPQTSGLVNKGRLNLMKPTAFLINTSRGGLIVEPDLRAALLGQQIAGAALDVLSEEPPSAGHPLLGISNCLITPHQAWASQASRKRLLAGLVTNIKAFLSGQTGGAVNIPFK